MGTLFIVATPIGNLEDISVRALTTLFSGMRIYCEDTRRTGQLLSLLSPRFPNIVNTSAKPILTRYDNHTEQSATIDMLTRLENDESVILVSDAGTPLISDPGYTIVKEARKRDIPVISIPGPSAVTAALSVSGLPADKILFLGYPPEKSSHRITLFQTVLNLSQSLSHTVIFYEAPHKIHGTFTDLLFVYGDIPIVIIRELTKIHETYWHGTISEALATVDSFKGELVVLFHLPAV